jgi:4-carboxymuconolactone decarboxylase
MGEPMDLEQKKILEEMKKKRGFILDFHKILIEEDLEFLKRYEELISTAYARQRSLSKKVKELVFIAALTALEADKSHIGAHMKVAMESGASKQEILEVLECIFPPCGVLRFMNGLDAFKETVRTNRAQNTQRLSKANKQKLSKEG